MIKIPPSDRKFVQTNRSDFLGNLYSSFNLDLQSNLGVIRIGKRMKFNSSPGSLGLSVGFKFFDGRVWTIAGTTVFKNTGFDLTSAFVADASSSAVTTYDSAYSDLEVFNGALATFNAGTHHLYTKAADGSGTGAWTDRGALGSSNTLRKMTYFKKFDRLYFGGGESIVSCDTSWNIVTTGDYSLTLALSDSNSGGISSIIAGSDRIWIVTNHNTNAFGICSVFEWDGISAQVTKEYKIVANGIMSIILQDDVPIILDSNGILSKYTGIGFSEIGRFPLRKEQSLGNPSNTGNDARFIHPNGMVLTENDTILALIMNQNDYTTAPYNINENLPSGIWEWSSTSNFIHKHPVSYMPVGSTTVTDHGQNIIAKAGGLALLKIASTSAKGVLICGAQYYTDATTTAFAIFSESPYPNTGEQKYGYFVTTWILSTNVKDSWQKVWARYRQFLNVADKIILKYRTIKADPINVTGTWTSTTTFTTTTDLTALGGYEVEVLQGTGSGKCSHIFSVVNNAGTYTITVDETYTGVTSGTFIARIQAWIKSSSVTGQNKESDHFIIGKESVRIQIKCCMQFTDDDELYELALLNKPNQLLE